MDDIPMDEVVIDDNAGSLINESNQNEDIHVDSYDHAETSTSGYIYRPIHIVRGNRKIRRLNTRLLNAIEDNNETELKSCLQNGASPNATCFLSQISACHAAAYYYAAGLDILLKNNADKNVKDAYGRSPLHIAAWAGNDLAVTLLLGLPAGIGKTTEHPSNELTSSIIDVLCERVNDSAGDPIPKLADLPKSCIDSLEHKCERYLEFVPKFNSNWTPLHVSSYAANHSTTELLLAAGANPNSRDKIGQTPLDVLGAACYLETDEVNVKNYVKTIQILIKYGGELNTDQYSSPNCFSALHTALELCSIEAIRELLAAGAPVTHYNAQGNTPLHECVMKGYEGPLKMFINHRKTCESSPTVDVKNESGHTVLHMAIEHSWARGVCIALDAGANVTAKANDGATAIHMAASKGHFAILREVLENVHDISVISDECNGLEAPLICAMRSGNLNCVRIVLQKGASLSISFCKAAMTFSSPVTTNNSLIVHAATDIGNVNILRHLLNEHNNLKKLLNYKTIFFHNYTPVEYVIWCIKTRNDKETYFDMFKFLLEVTPGIGEYFPPIAATILDVPVSCHDKEIILELLKCVPSALDKHRTRLLHQAILRLNEEIILKLIEKGADLSAAVDKDTALTMLMRYHPSATEFITNIFDSCISSNGLPVNDKDNVVTINYDVLVPTQNEPLERLKVLTALLNTGNQRGQRKLLAHLLVITFVHLHWKAYKWILYIILLMNTLFVSLLTIYVWTVFYLNDTKSDQKRNWGQYFWQFLVFVTLFLTILLELSYINKIVINWKSFHFWLKCLMKFGTFVLPIPLIITLEFGNTEWQRNLASLTLFLAWMNVMVLMSIHSLMIQIFWKVTAKVLKILLSASFLIFMFSVIFMIQSHADVPFNGPLEAIIKTLVMMTSEFDYGEKFKSSRLVFVIFVILVAIAVMNVMTGVAVDDIQKLIEDGYLRKLEKQVYLINKLEISTNTNPVFKILKLSKLIRGEKIPEEVKIYPFSGEVRLTTSSHMCSQNTSIQSNELDMYMEAIIDKAREQFDKASLKADYIKNESQFKEIHKAVTSNRRSALKTKSRWRSILHSIAKRKNRSKYDRI